MASTSYRDRTSEFHSIAERLKKSSGNGAPSNGESHHPWSSDASSFPAKALALQSEFNKKASRIGLAIHQTTQKLDKLAKLAKRTSMFDDPTVEIQELTAVIKQDITALNASIEELQLVCQSQESIRRNKATSDHATTVVDNLKSRLMGATQSFKDVLTLRTESLKVHESRRSLFSGANHAHAGGKVRQRQLSASGSSNAPPPWLPSTSSTSSSTAAELFSDGTSSSRFPDAQKGPGGQLQQVVTSQDTYMQSRTDALQNVESTILELGTIFQNLALMVQQQGEVAVRIDQDIEDTLSNVEGAQAALVKYFNQISSNRWLIIKIFFVLMIFLLIFVVFVA